MKRVITASTIYPDGTIQEGMYWNVDGHKMTVTEIRGDVCNITESWIAENTGEPVKSTETYDIQLIDDVEYAVSREYPKFKLCATAAFNYPWEDGDSSIDDDWQDMYDYYTPSASRGDYSPSSPWNAPGMSIHDFI